jgi:serine/threonine protein kinase
MSIKHILVGRGGFGFVVSPNLFLVDDSTAEIKFKTVSKIFIDKNDAQNEVDNHKLIDNIDSDYHYHLRMLPINNDDGLIDIGFINKVDLKKLNLPHGINKLIKNKNYYMNYEFGGMNLVDLFDDESKHYSKTIYVRICVEFLKVIQFVKKMIENNLIHHDLKPNNIVVDNNLTLKVIDFGLLESMPEYYNYCSCETNPNPMELYEYFPFENEYYNINNFRNRLEISSKAKYIIELSHLKCRYPCFFEKYVAGGPPVTEKSSVYQKKYMEMIDLFSNGNNDDAHYNFIKASFLTFDIYTLGLTLVFITEQYVQSLVKKRTFDHCYCSTDYQYKYPDWLHFDALFEIICKMITPNVFERIKIDELICEFEKYVNELEK